ncbi:hypothetical protein M405DRAFT_880376 [Rhizopogon salebrosus TDB-379]|nr:hypothetical protein M405DRAFT_880376 [Rhizopogon salebrosus TDB-379]
MTCNSTLGSKIVSPVPPCVPFDCCCHSALLRWMTRFATAIRDCTIPFNAMPKVSVIQFAVWDKDSNGESGFVGYCYLDRLPRGMGTTAAKYSYTTVWSPGPWAPVAKCYYFLVAMVSATLARSIADRPALMPPDDERYLSKRWNAFSMGKIFLVGGNREQTVAWVAYAVEQDFLGRPLNSDVSLKEMFGQAPATNL